MKRDTLTITVPSVLAFLPHYVRIDRHLKGSLAWFGRSNDYFFFPFIYLVIYFFAMLIYVWPVIYDSNSNPVMQSELEISVCSELGRKLKNWNKSGQGQRGFNWKVFNLESNKIYNFRICKFWILYLIFFIIKKIIFSYKF